MFGKMKEMWKRWDENKPWFGEIGERILKLKQGEKIGNLLNNSSICPVRNATCTSFIELHIYGLNLNEKAKCGEIKEIWICPYGCKDIEGCKLSK